MQDKIKQYYIVYVGVPHHDLYRHYWNQYSNNSYNSDRDDSKQLERLMDEQQNYFTYDEFQQFKVTLSGYIEHWKNRREQALAQLQALINNQKKRNLC